MKRELLILLSLVFIVGCTETARINSNLPSDTADNEPSKELNPCDQNNLCPGGFSCNIFKDYENKPVCWPGFNPCDRCSSNQCDILESFPVQIVCK